MFKDKRSKASIISNNKNDDEKYKGNKLSKSIEENIQVFKDLFRNDETLIVRRFENQKNTSLKCCILFIDGMINNVIVNENIIKPIVFSAPEALRNNIIDGIMYHALVSSNVEKTSEVEKIIEAIIIGDTALFLEGSSETLLISSKGWQIRAIAEPEGERVIRGARDGFNESLIMNLTMIRRKISTEALKFQFRELGQQTRTKICLCYIDGIANGEILNEINKRLDTVDIDGILGSGWIVELIKDSPFSPFKTIGSTERPDKVAAKLLEGHIAIIVDGTPVALTLPHLFVEYFQTSEDYNINYYFSSINRLIRVLSFWITISLPAIFISVTTFHQEMVPSPLIRSISAARQGVPFPTAVETLSLLITFDILRETGTRMPTQIGQALSIVGALVLGQAAVEARIVSAPVIIVVALTGITGLAIPRLKGAEIVIRLLLLLFSSILGLYGYMFGLIGLLIHLFSMRSFGVPYMLTLTNFDPKTLKDTVIRAPLIYMKYRPKFIAVNNRIRNATRGKKQ